MPHILARYRRGIMLPDADLELLRAAMASISAAPDIPPLRAAYAERVADHCRAIQRARKRKRAIP